MKRLKSKFNSIGSLINNYVTFRGLFTLTQVFNYLTNRVVAVNLHVTGHCNLHCNMCMAKDIRTMEALSLDELKNS